MKKLGVWMLALCVSVMLLGVTSFAAAADDASPVDAAVEEVSAAVDAAGDAAEEAVADAINEAGEAVADAANAAAEEVVAAGEELAADAEAVANDVSEAVADAANAAEEAVAAGADAAQAGDSDGESAGDAAGESDGESSGDSAGDAQGADGPPDFNSPSFNPGLIETLNVISSAIVLPLCFLSIILWFFRAFGTAIEKKNNGWLKIYKGLRKIHIPVGAATIILGLYHTLVASINHGFSLNWGMAAMIFFLLGFVCWIFRKQLKRKWLVLHRFTTLIATICMMIHCAPYLKIVFTVVLPAVLRSL